MSAFAVCSPKAAGPLPAHRSHGCFAPELVAEPKFVFPWQRTKSPLSAGNGRSSALPSIQALDRVLGPNASKIKRGEHSFRAPDELEELLIDAKFANIEVQTVVPEAPLSSDEPPNLR